MTAIDVDAAAAALLPAWKQARQRDVLPAHLQPVDAGAAYAVQDRLVERIGAPLAGWKIGATDTALRHWLGLSEPFYGRVFLEKVLPSPATIAAAGLRSLNPLMT